jgi:hypothetical protein
MANFNKQNFGAEPFSALIVEKDVVRTLKEAIVYLEQNIKNGHEFYMIDLIIENDKTPSPFDTDTGVELYEICAQLLDVVFNQEGYKNVGANPCWTRPYRGYHRWSYVYAKVNTSTQANQNLIAE